MTPRSLPPPRLASSWRSPASAAFLLALMLAGCNGVKERDLVIRGGRALLRDSSAAQVQDDEWQKRRALWLIQAAPYADEAPVSSGAPK